MFNRRRYQNMRSGKDNRLPLVAGLHRQDTEQFLLQHFRSANLQRRSSTKTSASDMRFTTNEDFWEKLLYDRRLALRWVELRHFQIVDWFPRAPGLYHTNDAERARKEAQMFISEENGIRFYEPRGKLHMIQGGVGSVRFKPISIEGDDCWLCTATSDKFCHSGIPIAIPNYLIEKLGTISTYHYKIMGQVKFLPEFLEHHFYHMSRIPQVYVFADRIEQLSKDRVTPVEITPMVFFVGGHRLGLEQDENVTYITCPSDSNPALDQASEWLQWYADRYEGEIVTNFDQQRPTFQEAPFSLQNLMNGKIKKSQLHRFHIDYAEIICDTIQEIHTEAATVKQIKVTLGNGNTFYGDFVVAESIKNSFNKAAEANISSELKDLLKELDSGKNDNYVNIKQQTPLVKLRSRKAGQTCSTLA